MRHYLLEECYEVLDVMTGDNAALHKEELGDLLFQIVFQAQIRNETGQFSLSDVIDGICDKLERRHPHVFGNERIDDPQEVAMRWESLKAKEGKGTLAEVPRALPALMQAEKVGRRVSRVGFDWPDVDGAMEKIQEELAELREAMSNNDPDAFTSELGDVLFSVVNVARHLGVSPELSLRASTDRFMARFQRMEADLAAAGRSVQDVPDTELNQRWERAKRDLNTDV